jgi:hypothetical protein
MADKQRFSSGRNIIKAFRFSQHPRILLVEVLAAAIHFVFSICISQQRPGQSRLSRAAFDQPRGVSLLTFCSSREHSVLGLEIVTVVSESPAVHFVIHD